MANEDRQNEGGQSQLVLDSRTKPKPLHKVIMLNDDYTPMEFVVHVLQQFFGRSSSEATKIMRMHINAVLVCAVFTVLRLPKAKLKRQEICQTERTSVTIAVREGIGLMLSRELEETHAALCRMRHHDHRNLPRLNICWWPDR